MKFKHIREITQGYEKKIANLESKLKKIEDLVLCDVHFPNDNINIIRNIIKKHNEEQNE